MITKLALVSTEFEGTAVLIASGEIDLATAPDLAKALANATAPATALVVSLAGIEFIDSSGLHILAKAHIEARAVRCRVLIVPSPAVTRLLDLADAGDVFELCTSVPEALNRARALD